MRWRSLYNKSVLSKLDFQRKIRSVYEIIMKKLGVNSKHLSSRVAEPVQACVHVCAQNNDQWKFSLAFYRDKNLENRTIIGWVRQMQLFWKFLEIYIFITANIAAFFPLEDVYIQGWAKCVKVMMRGIIIKFNGWSILLNSCK